MPKIFLEKSQKMPVTLQKGLQMSTDYFFVPSSSSPHSITSSDRDILIKTLIFTNHKPQDLFRNEIWVVPVLVLSAITMVSIAVFEIFVLCKARRTIPSRRHLFLGQMLLMGLFSCSVLATLTALTPTAFTCGLMRFGIGMSYAIVMASLLVKCVFLISLNSGVYLPAPYQGLLLLFAVMVQVVIGIQWLVTSTPSIVQMSLEKNMHKPHNKLFVTAADISKTESIPVCHTTFTEMLLSLIYVVFLNILVAVLAVKSRGIRDNYREAAFIGLAVLFSIVIWLVWTMTAYAINERYRDACIASGLAITSLTVFCIMFMPKGRQLAAMGREGVYLEDREERFSALSKAASGYSPSFFHLKPMKYAMTYRSKHQPTATLETDEVTLSASPPSYTGLLEYPPGYYSTRYIPGGLYLRSDDRNLYTTLEPTLSSNPNVYFQRGNELHPGMMY